MPVKKATRSTRSTRTTKASSKVSSSDAIPDENIDSTTYVIDAKKKSTKSAEPKKVLGERNAPSNNLSDLAPSTTTSKSQSKSKTASTKSTKTAIVEADSRSTTPVPHSPSKKRLPEDQVQAVLSNYDLETQARTSRLKASLEMSIQSSITRMRLAIERIPRAVRELPLREFINLYGANIHAFMNNAPVSHLADTQQEWDQIREERSPAKTKRSKLDQSKRPTTSSARSRNPTKSSTPSNNPLSSAIEAPSLPTFNPNLPKDTLKTPKARMARPGEIITWHSINGSPICGIIAEDGVVRPVQFA